MLWFWGLRGNREVGAVLILLWGELKARSSHGRATHSRKGKAEGAFLSPCSVTVARLGLAQAECVLL